MGYNISMQGIGGVAIDGPRLDLDPTSRRGVSPRQAPPPTAWDIHMVASHSVHQAIRGIRARRTKFTSQKQAPSTCLAAGSSFVHLCAPGPESLSFAQATGDRASAFHTANSLKLTLYGTFARLIELAVGTWRLWYESAPADW